MSTINEMNIRDIAVITIKDQSGKEYTLLTNAPHSTVLEAVEFSKEFESEKQEYVQMFLRNNGYVANYNYTNVVID